MMPDRPAVNQPERTELTDFLESHWPEIVQNATRRAVRRFAWNRRIGQANRFLIVAALLMMLQMNWGAVTLMRMAQRPATVADAAVVVAENDSRPVPRDSVEALPIRHQLFERFL